MATTNPDDPHDSRAEEMANRARDDAAQSLAELTYDATGLAIRLRALADDDSYCRDEWSASVCRQAADMIDRNNAKSPAEPAAEAIRDGLTPTNPDELRARLWPSLPPVELREERGLWGSDAQTLTTSQRPTRTETAPDNLPAAEETR